MARTLKGTRARGLPPKVLLSQRQDTTGSFPTIWRTSSDNRTGRYPVFFNDNKVVTFNQPVTNVGITVEATYPEYEEKVVTIGSPGNPVNQSNPIIFDYSFSGTPFVVLTELTPNANTPIVNAFIDPLFVGGMTIKFSAPFEGTIVYRALYQSSPGNPVNVLRSPRFVNQYSLAVVNNAEFDTNNILGNPNTADITFSDFGSVPTENYVTFYDFYTNNQANISSSISVVTNTSAQVTGSAAGDVVLYYMGVGASTASIDVSGIVYPLVMTPQAINADLSPEAKSDLYKQPFFSGSEIVNQPIVASGSMKKNVSDIFVTFTPGQDIEPFQDFANPEVDAKISNVTSSNYRFFATGSLVETTGLGFQQPVWSKNKIEIDITPAADQTITMYQSASVGSYPMYYWNFATKQYEGKGNGKGIQSVPNTLNGLKTFLEEQTFGFASSMDVGGLPTGFSEGIFNVKGRQISDFGFPYHPKFKPTTNQQLNIGNHISEPFLLEKVVIEFYGKLKPLASGSFGTTAIWTFFLLNNRPSLSGSISPSQTIVYQTNPGAITPPLSFTTSSLLDSTVLDVVDHMQICVSNSFDTKGYLQRELLLNSGELVGPMNGPRQFVLSSSVKTSIAYEAGAYTAYSGSFGNESGFVESLDYSGRNQLNQANGRDWSSTFSSPVVAGTASYFIASYNYTINVNETYTKQNPYVLLPTDKLVFGVQLPWATGLGGTQWNDDSTSVDFSQYGINKIILYGSTLRVNPETNQLEEYHDTLNQLLSSNSIHEVIGE